MVSNLQYLINLYCLVQLFKKYYFVDIFQGSDYASLTKEEKKIYNLTQCNTILNRDLSDKLDKRELYLKNVELYYKDIYGNKGVRFCNKMKNITKCSPKKNFKVQFSNNIQYSSILSI